MGVHGLWQLLKTAGKPVPLESLEGKVLAVDVSIWLNKAAKGMRDRFGNPVHNAHLILIFQRICKLLFYKVKPIIVFDGGVPELKKKTIAARRERKLTAGDKELKTQRKLLHNYLKGKALETVTGKKGPTASNAAIRREGEDLFALPPVSFISQNKSSSEDEDIVDAETEWISSLKNDQIERMFAEVGSVDIDDKEFQSLPSEIQHEILMEMKDSYRRRYNRRKTQEMPEEAHDFSDFQLSNLFRRGKITKKIDDVRKEMKTRSSGQIAELEEEKNFRKNIKSVEANRIASEDKHHYILLKKDLKNTGNILFNAELESDKLEIYKGIKRKENFERLEREPVQFSSSSIDESNIVNFVSDSAEDSDYDIEFTLSDARMFITGQDKQNVIKSQSASVEGHFAESRTITSHTETKNANEDIVSTKYEIMQSSSENSSEELDGIKSYDSSVVLLVDDKEPIETLNNKSSSGSNKSLGKDLDSVGRHFDEPNDDISIDLLTENRLPNATKANVTAANDGNDPCDKDVIVEKDENTLLHIVAGKASPDAIKAVRNQTQEHALTLSTQFAVIEKEGGVHLQHCDTVTPDLSTAGQSEISISLDETKKADSSLACEDDVSAVPKPEHSESDQTENEESKELQRFIEDCNSAESLDTLQERLFSEQGQLLKVRERQSRAAASVGGEEYSDVQELLRLFGIPYIVSPMEAEAQCAVLDISNQTHGSITDDSDILLFGGRRVYKNVFHQDKYAELYTTENINHALFLDREKMIALAYLTGSDYTEGIRGVGVITAMEILQEFGGGSMQALTNLKKWYEDVKCRSEIDIFEKETKLKAKLRLLELPKAFPNPQVWEAYIHPTAEFSDELFEWGKPDLDAVREFARHKFGWHSSRTDEFLLPIIKQFNSNQGQTTLQRYFPRVNGKKRVLSSKRLQRTVNLMRSGSSGAAEGTDKTRLTNITGSIDPEQNASVFHESVSHRKRTRSSCQDSTPISVIAGTSSSNNAFKSMSYKKRRMPTKRDFQRRIAKSRSLSRGHNRRVTRPVQSSAENSQMPDKRSILSKKIDLSESSSDSDA